MSKLLNDFDGDPGSLFELGLISGDLAVLLSDTHVNLVVDSAEYRDGDWFTKGVGRIFEYHFDIGQNTHRWCEIDTKLAGLPKGRRVTRPKEFSWWM